MLVIKFLGVAALVALVVTPAVALRRHARLDLARQRREHHEVLQRMRDEFAVAQAHAREAHERREAAKHSALPRCVACHAPIGKDHASLLDDDGPLHRACGNQRQRLRAKPPESTMVDSDE